jgi:Homeodomain-like domain
MPAAVPIEVTASQQRELRRTVNAKTSNQREVCRARIILALAEGLSHEEIAKEQSVSLLAIGRWRKRFAARAPGRAQRCPWTGTQTAAFGQGCRTGLESGAHASSAPGVCARWPGKPA